MAENASVCQNCLATVPQDQVGDHQKEHLEATESAKGQEFQSFLGMAAADGFGSSNPSN